MATLIDFHFASDLSEWTTTATDSGDLSQAAGAGLAGTSGGMQFLVDDTTALYGFKAISPASTTGLIRFRWYLDPNGITIATGTYFNAAAGANLVRGVYTFYIDLGYENGVGYKIRGNLLNDVGGNNFTSPYVITDEPHYIEVYIQRASTADANDGSMALYIDGVLKETKSGVDNYNYEDSFGRFYLSYTGGHAGDSGTFFQDELVVNNDGSEIGPVSGDISIPLDTLTLAGSVPQADAQPGAVSVTLDAINLSAGCQSAAISIAGTPQTITLATASLAGIVPSGSVSAPPPGVSVSLATVSLASSFVTFSINPGVVSVQLDTLDLLGSIPAGTVTVDTYPQSIALDTLTLQSLIAAASAGGRRRREDLAWLYRHKRRG